MPGPGFFVHLPSPPLIPYLDEMVCRLNTVKYEGQEYNKVKIAPLQNPKKAQN